MAQINHCLIFLSVVEQRPYTVPNPEAKLPAQTTYKNRNTPNVKTQLSSPKKH